MVRQGEAFFLGIGKSVSPLGWWGGRKPENAPDAKALRRPVLERGFANSANWHSLGFDS